MPSSTDAMAQFGSAEFRRDPFPYLHWLRENDPVHRTSAGFFLLSRHADVAWALRNTMTEFRAPDRAQLETQYPPALHHVSAARRMDTLGLKNDPEHARLRRLVGRDFTVRRIEALQGQISVICDGLLDAITEPLQDGEIVDLHETVSKPLTLRMFSELFGVPAADSAWIGDALLDILLTVGSTDEEKLSAADEQTLRVEQYFEELVDQVRHSPREDLVSGLVSTHDDDPDSLDDAELMAMLWALWLTGFETTAAGIDLGVLALLDHPEHGSWLRDRENGPRAFVEEVLRHGAVVLFGAIPRITTRDMEFSGVTVAAGTDVRPLLGAANRDPEVFADPDRFDPARDTRAALHLGHGARFCIGAALARTQVALALTRVHSRFPTLVGAGEPTWSGNIRLHSVDRLPVAIDG